MNNEQDHHQSMQIESPGQHLAIARERMGLSQQQVADNLHLRLNTIISLEHDELEEGVSITFTKGYIRLYANLVDLDKEPLLRAFDAIHNTQTTDTKLQSFSRRVEREANDSRWNFVTYVIVFLVIASLGFWWYDNHGKDSFDFLSEYSIEANQAIAQESVIDGDNNQTETSEIADVIDPQMANSEENTTNDELLQVDSVISSAAVEESEVSENVQLIEQQLADYSEPQLPATDNQQSDISDISDIITAQSTEEIIEQETVVSPQPNEQIGVSSQQSSVNEDLVSLSFTFIEDCWLSVTDATDEAIAYGIKNQGYVMDVQGVPPISINLCPPTRVQIEFEGQLVDLTEFNPRNSVAFQLPFASN